MQQTETYKLNLIDTSDTFSPDPLNKNMETLETELARVESETAAALDAKAPQTALDDGLDALSGRVGTLEAGQLVYTIGTYKGKGGVGSSAAVRLEFDFKPLVVWVCDTGDMNHGYYPWIRDQTRSRVGSGFYVTLTWEEQAVSWYGINGADYQLNSSGTTYRYFALGIPV